MHYLTLFFRPASLVATCACLCAAPVLAQTQSVPIAQGKGVVVAVSRANIWEPDGSLSRRITVQTDPALLRQAAVKRKHLSPELAYLNRLVARGFAAGLTGVLYDNRDRKHSNLDPARLYPQLTAISYGPEMKARYWDHGLAGDVLFSLPTIGNSSTANTNGALARSHSRLAMGNEFNAARIYEQYRTNHIYVYPEHRDHDPKTGDRFFANVPYVLTSQGSSSSDRPFLEAASAIIAALTPDTRFEAERSGRIAPTVQMVLRRTMEGIESDDDYMSGPAHPSAFIGEKISVSRAISLAHSLTPETLPPVVTLKVDQDLSARPGQDYLITTRNEAVFTTPSAISRVWRSFAYERTLELSIVPPANGTADSLSYHWKLLRGDPEKIKITPSEDGLSARIHVQWHEAFPVPGRPNLQTSRIDIGVFADNGAQLSAPAFVSVAFPTYQNRQYVPDSKGEMRLESVDYFPKRGVYVDPALWPVAKWKDTFQYAQSGALAGFSRTYESGRSWNFFFKDNKLLTNEWTVKPSVNRQVLRADGRGGLWLYDKITMPK